MRKQEQRQEVWWREGGRWKEGREKSERRKRLALVGNQGTCDLFSLSVFFFFFRLFFATHFLRTTEQEQGKEKSKATSIRGANSGNESDRSGLGQKKAMGEIDQDGAIKGEEGEKKRKRRRGRERERESNRAQRKTESDGVCLSPRADSGRRIAGLRQHCVWGGVAAC